MLYVLGWFIPLVAGMTKGSLYPGSSEASWLMTDPSMSLLCRTLESKGRV